MEIGGPLKQPHVNLENDQFKKPHVAHHRDIFWEDSLCFIDPQIRIQRLMWMLAGAFFFRGRRPPSGDKAESNQGIMDRFNQAAPE